MNLVGAVILLVGVARAIRAIAGLRLALRSPSSSTFDWSCATLIWIAWCAIGLYLTVASAVPFWSVVALAALLAIAQLLGLKWRAKHSTSHSG